MYLYISTVRKNKVCKFSFSRSVCVLPYARLFLSVCFVEGCNCFLRLTVHMSLWAKPERELTLNGVLVEGDYKFELCV